MMDGKLKFQFAPYQRNFKQPLVTNHGVWSVREGIIITLTNSEGVMTQGEIAPLPWFGSETLEQAQQFCQGLGSFLSPEQITNIPDHLPCCQFALESAWLDLNVPQQVSGIPEFCYLLPAGKPALTTWSQLYCNYGATTFKWKIGVYPLDQELSILRQLISNLPRETKLRLDANGALSLSQAQELLLVTDDYPAIEFIEQPLPPHQFAELQQLSREHSTTLALDESVAQFQQLRQAVVAGWPGVYVLKAAIMGYPSRLEQFCQTHHLHCVFSTVFETEVGRRAVLAMAQRLAPNQAVGFGVKLFA